MSFHGFSSEAAFNAALDRHITGNYGSDEALCEEGDCALIDPAYDDEYFDQAYDLAVELEREDR